VTWAKLTVGTNEQAKMAIDPRSPKNQPTRKPLHVMELSLQKPWKEDADVSDELEQQWQQPRERIRVHDDEQQLLGIDRPQSTMEQMPKREDSLQQE
jgi:hypothetical protein